jgi:hypothetical protein
MLMAMTDKTTDRLTEEQTDVLRMSVKLAWQTCDRGSTFASCISFFYFSLSWISRGYHFLSTKMPVQLSISNGIHVRPGNFDLISNYYSRFKFHSSNIIEDPTNSSKSSIL